MKFKFDCKREKPERKYILPFLEEYFSRYYLNRYDEITINCPDEYMNRSAPDYDVKETGLAIEIKRACDEKEVRKNVELTRAYKILQQKIDKTINERHHLKSILKKCFYLSFPSSLTTKVVKEKSNEIVDEMISLISKGVIEIDIAEIGRFRIIKQLEANELRIILATSSNIGALLYPAPRLSNVLKNTVEKANKQLASASYKRKILLLVDSYFLADLYDYYSSTISCFDYLYSQKNIDEIWLQVENITGRYLHTKLFDRSFYEFIILGDLKNIKRRKKEFEAFFTECFPSFFDQKDIYGDKIYAVMRCIFKKNMPHAIIEDSTVRELMVQLGDWLIKKSRFDDAIWIIEKFIHDPDPPEPNGCEDYRNIKYHDQIKKGETPEVISTVLGHLAWVVQKLAINKSYILKALNYTDELLRHKNLYVKLQAIIPLIEISKRRQWLKGYGIRPRIEDYRRFHRLSFGLLRMVKDNPNLKAIAQLLTNVFAYYKDLSTREAKEVLETLKISRDSAGLFLYFALFRNKHYRDQNIEFNPKEFSLLLNQTISDNSPERDELRAEIAWLIWKLLSENNVSIAQVESYINTFLEQPYNCSIYENLEMVLNEIVLKSPSVSLCLFKKFLFKLESYVAKTDMKKLMPRIHLRYALDICDKLSHEYPSERQGLINRLRAISGKGIYVNGLN